VTEKVKTVFAVGFVFAAAVITPKKRNQAKKHAKH